MSAALVTVGIAVIGGLVVAAVWRRVHARRHDMHAPPIHFEHAIQQIRETRSTLAATEQRAKERDARLARDSPTDDERLERLRVDVEIRVRDHGP